MESQEEMINNVLQNLQIAKLNEMQLATIEAVKKDNDLILVSPTGTGKTLAYLFPVISNFKNDTTLQAIILVPTRELALQIESVIRSMKTAFRVCCCYGGHQVSIEKQNLQNNPNIVIATPGRLADHINRGTINLENVSTLVLDEFDKSLEFGFHDDMGFIIEQLHALKKRILISATDAIQVPDFVGIKKLQKLDFTPPLSQEKLLETKAVLLNGKDKLDIIHKLICNIPEGAKLVFCNQRETVEDVSYYLNSKGIVSTSFHGGLEQADREKTLAKFRNGSYPVLVTTDLASRGLDIIDVQHVIHFDLAYKEDAFIHRNGRTARMNTKGTAFLLLRSLENMPDYVPAKLDIFALKEMPTPPKPEWETLFIGKGKKDKINKVDIVGFLGQKGLLDKEEIGLIELKDFFAFAAVKRNKIHDVMKRVANEKIKGIKAKIEIAK